MNRLVRAEVYRVLHSNHFAIWLVTVCLIFVVMMCVAMEDLFSLNLGEAMESFANVIAFMQMLVALFPAVVIGIGYMRKTAYYEVMAGNRISHILFSKMIADAIPVAICIFIATLIIPIILSVENGLGDVTQLAERVALYLVMLLHICVCSVWMMTAIRHISGAVLVYIRFSAFDLIVLLILSFVVDGMSTVPTWYDGVRNCFIMNQMSHIFLGEITSEFIIAVVVSLLLESVFWYIVSYIGMKKKLYG